MLMGRVRHLATVALGSLLLLTALGSAASAQVPETPELPPVPDPVRDATTEAQNTLMPYMIEAAITAQPAATAGGFVLRPACSATGTAVVVAALLGATLPLPVSPGLVMTPTFIMCGAAFDEGPADPVLQQVDAAAGPAVQDAAQPVLDQFSAAIAPARPNLSEACAAAALFGSAPSHLPPPVNRIALLSAICG